MQDHAGEADPDAEPDEGEDGGPAGGGCQGDVPLARQLLRSGGLWDDSRLCQVPSTVMSPLTVMSCHH